MSDLFRIGELAKRTNRTVRALRLYEELGILEPAERSSAGYRLYDEANMQRLEYIDRLQRIGLSLTQICEVLTDWSNAAVARDGMQRVRGLYRTELEAVRARIADLQELESELLRSVDYLEYCNDCKRTCDTGVHSCGPCIGDREIEQGAPALVSGLTAH